MEIIIIAVIAVWLVLAIRHSRKKGCCGDCSKCGSACKRNADTESTDTKR